MFHVEQYNLKLGKLGENIACTYLVKSAYVVIAKNARIGHKEVDLIVQKGKKLVFVEVKTAFSTDKALKTPEDYMSSHKINLLRKAIHDYCLILAKNEENAYIDLLTIRVFKHNVANISHYKNIC